MNQHAIAVPVRAVVAMQERAQPGVANVSTAAAGAMVFPTTVHVVSLIA